MDLVPDVAPMVLEKPAATSTLFRCKSTLPSPEELELIEAAYASQKALFDVDNEAALKAIKVGESLPADSTPPAEFAAWTMIANLVLNLDETVTRN